MSGGLIQKNSHKEIHDIQRNDQHPFSLTLAAYETTVLYAAIPNNTNLKSITTKTTQGYAM